MATPRYSKRHYEDVAKLLSTVTVEHGTSMEAGLGGVACLTQVMYDFADLFTADNPLFDRDRFLKACGLDD